MPSRAFHDHQSPGRQQARDDQRPQGGFGLSRLVGGVHEDQIEAFAAPAELDHGGRSQTRKDADPSLHGQRPDVALQGVEGGARPFDEDGFRSAAREGLEAEGSGACVEVEDPLPREAPEPREERFPDPVGRGADAAPGRRDERSPAEGSARHPQRARLRRAACGMRRNSRAVYVTLACTGMGRKGNMPRAARQGSRDRDPPLR